MYSQLGLHFRYMKLLYRIAFWISIIGALNWVSTLFNLYLFNDGIDALTAILYWLYPAGYAAASDAWGASAAIVFSPSDVMYIVFGLAALYLIGYRIFKKNLSSNRGAFYNISFWLIVIAGLNWLSITINIFTNGSIGFGYAGDTIADFLGLLPVDGNTLDVIYGIPPVFFGLAGLYLLVDNFKKKKP